MKLSELVEKTLCEIALGVKNARENLRSVMAICPATLNGDHVGEISYIDFEVSILVTEASKASKSNEKGAGGEIRVLSIGGIGGKVNAKSDGSNASSSQLSHRISFKVPVCMSAEFIIK